MMDVVSSHMAAELSEPGRYKRTGARILEALLFEISPPSAEEIPNETVEIKIRQRHELLTGWLALTSMIDSLRSCEFYFRRFQFSGLSISRADHLRNCCEMYFDRIAQFRDRIKSTLNAGKLYVPEGDFRIGAFVKTFDKVFDWQMRQRNRVHHKGRYDDPLIDQLSLIAILQPSMPEIRIVTPEIVIFRKASRIWVKRIKESADLLDQFMESISSVILENLPKSDIPNESDPTPLEVVMKIAKENGHGT